MRPGDDLARLIQDTGTELTATDVLVVAHKVVSKAEGGSCDLNDVVPGERARRLAADHGKDPRHTEVVLSEAAQLVRADGGRLICRTRHGFVCANAGVDQSNASAPDQLILLPVDPDASARALRAALPGRPAVLITDSFGRAWRTGQCEVAIGIAGLHALRGLARPAGCPGPRAARDDHRRSPTRPRPRPTWSARKDSREPAVRVRGLHRHITADDGPGVAPLVRRLEDDLFR